MISRNTVFIIGAGASRPYGFPLGNQLRRDILEVKADYLHQVKFSEDRRPLHTESTTLGFKEAFLRSRAPSIDAFLANRLEYLEIGRIAIAKVLLEYEKLATLFDDSNEDDWYAAVFNEMRCQIDDVDKNSVSFVTFNYDRSLELSLYYFMLHTYQLSEAEAWETLKRFPILHVYGSLGSLNPESPDFVPYGGGNYSTLPYDVDTVHKQKIVAKAAKQIRVIPEHRSDRHSDEFNQAKGCISNAERIVCLGFAFDNLNVSRLSPSLQNKINLLADAVDGDAPCFAATVLGLAKAEVTRVAKKVSNGSRNEATKRGLYAMKSTEMLRHTGIHICDGD